MSKTKEMLIEMMNAGFDPDLEARMYFEELERAYQEKQEDDLSIYDFDYPVHRKKKDDELPF